MKTIEQGSAQKATAKKQEGTGFISVVTHQRHCAADQEQDRSDGLQQGVHLTVASPSHPADHERSCQQCNDEQNVADGSGECAFNSCTVHFDLLRHPRGRIPRAADRERPTLLL